MQTIMYVVSSVSLGYGDTSRTTILRRHMNCSLYKVRHSKNTVMNTWKIIVF